MKLKIHEYIDLGRDLRCKKICYIIISVSLFFFSCRKRNFPETVPADPGDFYFNGTVAGNAVSLRAGTDNYYMYSSYLLDNDQIYRFIADLKPAGCIDCRNSLRITINDYKHTLLNAGAEIDSSLTSKSYPIQGAPFYAVQYRSLFNKPAASYIWKFGDGTSSAQPNPLHIYSTAGNYSVSLKINAANGCQQFISNRECIKYPAVNSGILVQSSSLNSMSFTSFISNSGSYSYQWNFGDGSASNVPEPSHTYAIPGTYPVTLRVIGPGQDTIYAKCNVATQTSPMPCLTNYSVESVTRVVNPVPFSNIVINWTDENGDVYTSNNMLQPAGSYFKIISVEEYYPNERNEKTKKIKVNFSCEVYNGTRVKTLHNAEAVLCVSYR